MPLRPDRQRDPQAEAREERAKDEVDRREGVEAALLALGNGFLQHPRNQALRGALERGSLTTNGYFQQLLRAVYRLLFLLTVEDRDLLHPSSAADAAKALYAERYGLRKLRERSVNQSAHDGSSDLWEAVKIVFQGLARGEPRLGLPALAGIFAEDQCAALDAGKLDNRALLSAISRLSWLRKEKALTQVNWRDMAPEELGRVYESLLERVPQVSLAARSFHFASGRQAKGNARKRTGSYYTPDSLVQALLDSALDPVVANTIAAHPEGAAEAILNLSVVDPACGSGHFLLAAARRLAAHVARIAANGTPSTAEYRRALRQVAERCIYGVDLNPIAVELCKLSLWMEAPEPGLPLSSFDSHIQRGDALLGATPELMGKGIPDAAWEPIEGDDKITASALKRRNKKERSEPRLDHAAPSISTYAQLRERARSVDSAAYERERFAADMWCSAFVWPKIPGPLQKAAPTEAAFRKIWADGSRAPKALRDEVARLREAYQFFHWHLSFPQVFARGGFDVVLGNPPWERVKLQEQEFFASRSAEIAGAPNAAARKTLIAALPDADPGLWAQWLEASREAEGQSHLVRHTGRYPLCGKGDVNMYAVFAEHNRATLGPAGRAGFIAPPGLATDDTTKAYFQSLIAGSALVNLYEFENEELLFPHIDHRVRFLVITVAGAAGVEAPADISFGNRRVSMLADSGRHFSLSPADFIVLNPNTQTCPTFRSRRDADLNLAIYRRAGVLWREGEPESNPWGVRFMRMLDMANDSGLFRTRSQLRSSEHRLERDRFEGPDGSYLPLIEAKMVHHFDHRFGTYEGQSESQANQGKLPELDDAAHADPERVTLPDYWVRAAEMEERLLDRWQRGWLFGWRDICRSTDQRTVIASLIPRAATGDTFLLAMPSVDPRLVGALYANLASFVLDYAARQKVGGTHLKYHVFKQLPVLAPDVYSADAPWSRGTTLGAWILARVLELTYTAWDLEPFARDVGYEGPPFRWDPARRVLLRAELDAAFFHLYGLSHDDAAFILDTFCIVRKNEERAYGEYRTKRLLLEINDALADAARTGRPYRTRLNPPPADPRVAHPGPSLLH